MLFNLRGVVRICDVSSGCNWGHWSWGDSIHLGDHSWDASGDVAGCQGDGHGDWVRWVCWHSDIGGGGDGSRGVGIDWVGGGVYGGAGVSLARAVGHLRSAGSDGDNVGGALILVSLGLAKEVWLSSRSCCSKQLHLRRQRWP